MIDELDEIIDLEDLEDDIISKRTDPLSLTDENFKILKYVEKSFGESPSFILQLDGVEYISNGKNIFIENTKENQEKIIEEYDVKEELERLLNAPLLQDNTTVLDMSYMFAGCKFIVSVELDTANVTNMQEMFSWCSSLERVKLDITNVTNMFWMFFGCNLDILDKELYKIEDELSIEDELEDSENEIVSKRTDKKSENQKPYTPLYLDSYKEYNYLIEDYRVLIHRLLNYSMVARSEGILALESLCIEEKNSFLEELLFLAIDGCSPDEIKNIATLKIKWIIQSLINSPLNFSEEYIKEVNKELITIMIAISSIHNGDSHNVMKFKIIATKFDIALFEETQEFFLDLPIPTTVQQPSELIQHLKEYSIKMRQEGIENLIFSIEEETNQTVVAYFKYMATTEVAIPLKPSKLFVNTYLDKLQCDNEILKTYYEKELITIHLAIAMIQQGNSPRSVEQYLLSIYPEYDIKSLLK